jgi:hypothetical protein
LVWQRQQLMLKLEFRTTRAEHKGGHREEEKRRYGA